MSSTTVDLYTALIEAGVEKQKAKQVADKIITTDDAVHFATKADIASLKADLQRFIFVTLVSQAVFVISLTVTLIQVIG